MICYNNKLIDSKNKWVYIHKNNKNRISKKKN